MRARGAYCTPFVPLEPLYWGRARQTLIWPWTQGFAADPVYGRAKCLPMLGAFITQRTSNDCLKRAIFARHRILIKRCAEMVATQRMKRFQQLTRGSLLARIRIATAFCSLPMREQGPSMVVRTGFGQLPRGGGSLLGPVWLSEHAGGVPVRRGCA